MRTKNLFSQLSYGAMLLSLSIMLFSCQKNLTADSPDDFNVTADSASYKLGSPVLFSFQGGASHMISFYSGETLKDYEYRAGRIVDTITGGAVLAFSTAVNLGTQTNQLFVMASTNFNGDYSNITSVRAATWTDITTRFKYGTSTTFLATSADISDLLLKGKPLYIAFKYVTKPQAANGVVRQWSVQSLTLASKYKLDNTAVLNYADQPSCGFQLVDELKTTAPAQSAITTTLIKLQGNLYDPLAVPVKDPTGENWAISAPINTDKVNMGPDWALPIKGITAAALKEYRYTYPKAGTYKAVFISSNGTIDDQKQVVKTLNITINP